MPQTTLREGEGGMPRSDTTVFKYRMGLQVSSVEGIHCVSTACKRQTPAVGLLEIGLQQISTVTTAVQLSGVVKGNMDLSHVQMNLITDHPVRESRELLHQWPKRLVSYPTS